MQRVEEYWGVAMGSTLTVAVNGWPATAGLGVMISDVVVGASWTVAVMFGEVLDE
jgi:hypothetical protein